MCECCLIISRELFAVEYTEVSKVKVLCNCNTVLLWDETFYVRYWGIVMLEEHLEKERGRNGQDRKDRRNKQKIIIDMF